jgi:hypothetical protein
MSALSGPVSGFIALAMCVIATGLILSVVMGAIKKSPIQD